MRTYQRLVIARGGAELGTVNPAYPHNFLVANASTGTLKIGSTGTRYNSLPEIGSTAPEEFVAPSPELSSILESETEEPIVEQLEEMVWPIPKKTRSKKKVQVADDAE